MRKIVRTLFSEKFGHGLLASLEKEGNREGALKAWEIRHRASVSSTAERDPLPSSAVALPFGADIHDPSKVKESLDAAKKGHKIAVEASPKISDHTLLGAHSVLASLPTGMKHLLKERGFSVKLVHPEESPPEEFRVGDKVFTRNGQADYVNRKITVWEISKEAQGRLEATRMVTAHEVGHAAVEGLAAIIARGEDRRHHLRKELRAVSRKANDYLTSFYFANNREPRPGESREYDENNEKVGDLNREIKQIEDVAEAFHKFDEATRKEGGVTEYADSYVKDRDRGWKTDIWEYHGPLESDEYNPPIHPAVQSGIKAVLPKLSPNPSGMEVGFAAQKHWFESPEAKAAFPPGESSGGPSAYGDAVARAFKGSEIKPRAAITRAGNENFAEITGKAFGQLRTDDGRKGYFEWLKEHHPETHKAYKKLLSVFSRKPDIPKQFEVVK